MFRATREDLDRRNDFGRADVITVIVGVVVAGAILWRFRSSPLEALALAIVAATSARLSQVDFQEHRLPNRLVAPLALLGGIGVVLLGLIEHDFERSARALLIGTAIFLALFGVGLINGIGMGDVKFSFPLGVLLAWLGTDYLVLAAFVTMLSAGIYTLSLMVHTRSLRFFVPFGPFMAIGFVASTLALG